MRNDRWTRAEITRQALVELATIRVEYAHYLDACREDYRQGYRASHCQHGTSNWTDWDNICGPCEDGHTYAYGLDAYRDAITRATARVEKRHEIGDAYAVFHRYGIDVDSASFARVVGSLYGTRKPAPVDSETVESVKESARRRRADRAGQWVTLHAVNPYAYEDEPDETTTRVYTRNPHAAAYAYGRLCDTRQYWFTRDGEVSA